MKTTLLKEIRQRYKLPSPPFFVKLRKWMLCIGATITSCVGTFLMVYPDSTMLLIITVIGASATAVGTAMSYLPVNDGKK